MSLYVTVYLILFVSVQLSQCVSLSIYEQLKYKRSVENPGLYKETDDVYILTSKNFNSEVYGSDRAWLVEFYNSWCGFCKRFAPSWKNLATNLKHSRDLIAIAAIDCSDDENQPVCRYFEIMGYPTLRYFHENYIKEEKHMGLEVQKGEDVNSHRTNIIKMLMTEQKEGRGKMYPNLLPYTFPDTTNLFDNTSQSIGYAALIIEKADSYIGIQSALELHKENILVTYAIDNNTKLLNSVNVKTSPTLIFVNRNIKNITVVGNITTKEDVERNIKSSLKLTLKSLDEVIGKSKESNDKTDSKTKQKDILLEKIKKMGDVVFQMDFETTLRYSLRREVAASKTITGDKLIALRAYLNVLVKYFPLGKKGQVFLNQMHDIVLNNDPVLGSQIAALIKVAEAEDQQVFSSPKNWLACKGSDASFRGYPCGLWKMFHYLTINAAEQNIGRQQINPKEVLMAMHGYIKFFFGCADCSKHFQQMAVERNITNVTSMDASILWLWSAHNIVNKRLAGDTTEDPEYPKMQFPSEERCSPCRLSDGSWDENEVKKYLKHMYANINVRYIGSDTRILHMGLEGPEDQASSSIIATIDTSMCLILYFASFILLVILIRMFLNRGYRKKLYVHDLFGKV